MESRRDHEEFSQSEKETLPDGQASSLKPVTNRPSTYNSKLRCNRPYSRRGHDEQKARLVWQIYRKFARQYVNPDVTSLLLNVHVM